MLELISDKRDEYRRKSNNIVMESRVERRRIRSTNRGINQNSRLFLRDVDTSRIEDVAILKRRLFNKISIGKFGLVYPFFDRDRAESNTRVRVSSDVRSTWKRGNKKTKLLTHYIGCLLVFRTCSQIAFIMGLSQSCVFAKP